MNKFTLKLVFAAIALFSINVLSAQNTVILQGRILCEEKDDPVAKPLPFATISIKELGTATISNQEGRFEMKVSPGVYTISVNSLGYERLERSVDIAALKGDLELTLKETSFYMNEVTVMAVSKKSGASTSSTINRTAIDHMQATSLSDLISLLPGQSVIKPDLLDIPQVSIRSGNNMNLGVIVDGAPLSNNANMQIMSSAIGAATPNTRGTSPTTGIDMRTITTDNIESVTVIRGVASVEHGNIASGGFIVNTKAGKEPFKIRFNTNPNIYSVSGTTGFGLGENSKGGFMNVGGDYAYSVAKPEEGYRYYQRATGRVAYTNNGGGNGTQTPHSA